MTLDEFNLLPYEQKIATVLKGADHVAVRYEAHTIVVLYHFPGGLFAEVYYVMYTKEIRKVRAFTSSAPLEEYAVYVRLPDGL